jgi:hypothetical protein
MTMLERIGTAAAAWVRATASVLDAGAPASPRAAIDGAFAGEPPSLRSALATVQAAQSMRAAIEHWKPALLSDPERAGYSAANKALDRVEEGASRAAGRPLAELQEALRTALHDADFTGQIEAYNPLVRAAANAAFADRIGSPERAFGQLLGQHFGESAARDFHDAFHAAPAARP